MYLCTVRLESRNLLVRVELHQSMAHYALFYSDGSVSSYDTEATGLQDTIVSLVRDLVWSEVGDALEVVHIGSVDQDRLNQVLTELQPHYQIIEDMTSRTIQ